MDVGGRAGNVVHGGRRVWVPLVVVAALLALLAIEAVAAKAAPDDQELAAGTELALGDPERVTVRVGEGWTLDSGASDADSGLVLTRAGVTVRMVIVTFPHSETEPAAMWDGFSSLLTIDGYKGADVRLGEPVAFDTPSITGGQRADLSIDDDRGSGFVLPNADRTRAVEARTLASPGTTQEALDAADALIASITFDGTSS